MKEIFSLLAEQPFITLFLVVGAGYALGRLTWRGIGLGSTASSLIIALLLSLWATRYGVDFEVPEIVGTIFFNLFMFSVGMKVGPQFLAGMRQDARQFIFFGLFIPVFSLALMFGLMYFEALPPGLAPGIFAGANTATPGLGAAQSALTGATHLPPGVTSQEAIATMSTAFAFAYCISIVLLVVLTKVPAIIGMDPAGAAKRFEATLKGHDVPLPTTAGEFAGSTLGMSLRTFRLQSDEFIGRTVGELRQAYPQVSIERVLRGGKVLALRDEQTLARDDVVALYGEVAMLVIAAPRIGPEVAEPRAEDLGLQAADVVVHRPGVVGHKLEDLASGPGYGLHVNAMFRGGESVPFGPETVVAKGDVLRVTGTVARIRVLEKESGKVYTTSTSTDIVTLALGLGLGALIGLITFRFGSIKLQVGSAVGLLLVGITLSILRTRHPKFGGPYSEPARQFIEDIGLNVYLVILGLNSGIGVIHAISQGALGPILIGVLVVGFIPPIVAWIIGHKWMKMNTALLLGAVSGGRCNSAGLRSAQEETRSSVPAISYPPTFAISNIALTLFSYLIAMFE